MNRLKCLTVAFALFAASFSGSANAASSSVPNMPAASALTGTELLYTVQGGADRKSTPAQLATYFEGLVSGDCTITGNVITCSSIHATSGTLNGVAIGATTPSTGAFTTVTATGNVNVQGNVSSSSNTLPAGPTNSGVALAANPSLADVIWFDSTRTADNRTIDAVFLGGSFRFRFKNDAGSTVLPADILAFAGGFAQGVTAINSNSGSGAWTHTGNFVVTDPGTGNNLQLSGAASGAAPSLATTGANVNITMLLQPKGGGGVAIQGSSQVNALSLTGSVANATPVLSTGGSDTNVGLLLQTKGVAPVSVASAGGGVRLLPTTIATLPACTVAAAGGTSAAVSNGQTSAVAASNVAVGTTTGPATRLVDCTSQDGTTFAWTYH